MPIPIRCTGCEARYNVPDAAAGKLVKCPKCEARIKVPMPKVAEKPEPEELIEEEPQPLPKKKVAQPVEDDADDEPLPEKKNRRARDEDEDDADERPRKKKAKGKTKKGSNKVLFLVLAAVGGLILLGGGVTAALYFTKSKSTKPGENFAPIAKDYETISPRKTFKAVLPKPEFGSPVHVNKLTLNEDGTRLLVSMGTGNEVQIWDVQNEPKKLAIVKGMARGISNDGTMITGHFESGGGNYIELESGKPSSGNYIGTALDDINGSLSLKNAHFWWMRSTGWDKPKPFIIREGEPGKGNAHSSHSAGDDDRVMLANLVNSNKELMFGVPAQNKVRIFDFSTKSITGEFELANPRPYKGVGKMPSWDGFAVHPEGKWIAVRRRYDSEDPLEFFDSNGALSSQLGGKKFNESSGVFVPGRDMYIAALYSNAGAKASEGYNLVRKEITASFSGHSSTVWCVAVSGNGKVMASATLEGEICIYDLTQLK